jgi:cytosine/adenosine deaminase-related metal-dependent hydrolase
MLLRTGTTTVGDIEAVPQLLPAMWQTTPLRVLSFFEMIGITPRRTARAILQEAIDKIHSLKASRFCAGLSPHAPYTTLPELLSLTAAAARRQRWRVCTHLAESALELEMFAHGRGVMFDWLRRSGRDMSDCGKHSPAQHLERCGLLDERLLAVHVNHLGDSDAALLGRRKVNVAHCPRSHAYFHQGPFPLRKLARAGVNICLGTDSLASVLKTRRESIELNMFEEMRVLARREPRLPPRSIIRMATINGARALGMQGRVGELAPGTFADLIALPLTATTGDVWEKVLDYSGSVAASMIGGKWAIPLRT